MRFSPEQAVQAWNYDALMLLMRAIAHAMLLSVTV